VIPRLESSSIQSAAKSPGCTSSKTVPVAGGGTCADPYLDLRRKTAIWARVTGASGQ